MVATETSRPLLLPQNRRLRHLQGIYFRNLTLSRPRGNTIDDAALYTKTPSKGENGGRDGEGNGPQLHHAKSEEEFRPKKMRRRSSNWVGASPVFRQKKLEDVMDSRMADIFFTLHTTENSNDTNSAVGDGNEKGRLDEDPIYISEIIPKAMNPTFRFFDLSSLSPSITRQSTLTVKIWAKRGENEKAWSCLLEEEVKLSMFTFIGKTLVNHVFPPNCILFHLIDGIYTIELSSDPPTPAAPKAAPPVPTSTYSALMRLSNLDESIQDALATREEIASQINDILNKTPIDESAEARERAKLAEKYVHAQKKLLKSATRRRDELKASILARKRAIQAGKDVQTKGEEDISNAQEKVTNCRTLVSTAQDEIHQQRRRICEELLNIFPIEPTPSPLLFTICNLALPNSQFDFDAMGKNKGGDGEGEGLHMDEDTISAALGYTALLINNLQYYLSIPLPYPITPSGSRSLIHDHISSLQTSSHPSQAAINAASSSSSSNNSRAFPLYNKKGSIAIYKFEYAVFLLNKDVERLAEGVGIRVLDIRETLPNLRLLLCVCAAGKDEIPGRKMGVMRGLGKLIGRGGNLVGSGGGSLMGSRRGSDDSNFGGGVGTGNAIPADMGKKVRGVLENGGVKGKFEGGENGNGFGESHMLPVRSLRTSGLRENVSK